jgi:hypothetical protein
MIKKVLFLFNVATLRILMSDLTMKILLNDSLFYKEKEKKLLLLFKRNILLSEE